MSWVISNFHIFFRSLWLSRRRTPCRIWKWRKRNGSSRGDALRLRTKLEHLPKCLAISNSLPLLLPFYTLPTPSPSPRVWYFPSLVLSEVTYLLFTKCYLFFFVFGWFIGLLVWNLLVDWVLKKTASWCELCCLFSPSEFCLLVSGNQVDRRDMIAFMSSCIQCQWSFFFFFFWRRGRRLYL